MRSSRGITRMMTRLDEVAFPTFFKRQLRRFDPIFRGTKCGGRLYKLARHGQSQWDRMNDDEQIISQVLADDTEAYRLLVSRHERLVFGFVHNLVRNESDVEDIAQEVFVAAFTHLDSFDPKRAKFSTWLLTIARNRCCNFLKRRPLTTGDVGELVSDALPPETEAVARETWSRLDAALDRLSI